MSDFSITRNQGETISFAIGPIVRGSTLVDLTAAGMILVVTGKIRSDDETPVFVKDYYQVGGAPNGGIVLTPGMTDSVDVTIPFDEPGIVALALSTYVQVDALLWEPNNVKTIVARGVLKIRALYS